MIVRHSTRGEDIINLTLRSASAKGDVCIFELSSMNDIMPMDTAEDIRRRFVENGTKVRQLTNISSMSPWTGVDDMEGQMQIRYIDPKAFSIAQEIVVFNDVVSIYVVQPQVEFLEITSKEFAGAMRQLFDLVWLQAMPMKVNKGGEAHL